MIKMPIGVQWDKINECRGDISWSLNEHEVGQQEEFRSSAQSIPLNP